MDANDEEQLRQLRVLHGALVLGCLAFLAVSTFLVPPSGSLHRQDTSTVFLAVGVGALLLIAIAFIVLKRASERIPPVPGADQWKAIRSAHIQHWALIEMPAFINIGLVLAGAGQWHLVLAVLAVVVLALRAPTRSRIDAMRMFR